MRKLTISVDNRRFAVMALLIVGAFLRLHQLDRYPLGVHQDEVSNIYDGWSIAETGADRFGDPYPTVVRAFGERDYRPALYAWLAAIPVRFTGFSITSGRLPAALLGVASLVLVYVFARNMAGETYGLLALLLATLSPLHVQLSRVAHEGGMLPPFFVILVLWLWQKNAREDFPLRWLIFLGLAIGVSTNSYQSTRLIAPLLLIAVAVDIVRHASSRLRRLTLLCAGAIIGALPQLLFLANETDRFMARARVLSVSTGGPVSYLSSVLYNFWLNLEPYYLFMPRVLRGLTVARLLPIEAPFFYGGLIGLAFLAVRQVSRDRIYVYLALAIAILPAALTTGNPSTMRASGIAVLTPLFSAAGVVLFGNLIRNTLVLRRIYYPAVVGATVLMFAAMAFRYVRSPYFQELSFQKIGVDMGRALGRHEKRYKAVFIERYVSIPYIYVAAFAPIPPREFHRIPKRLYSDGMDAFTRVGKYYFVVETIMPSVIGSMGRDPRFLFVSPKRIAGLTAVDSVSFGTQKLLFQTCGPTCRASR